MQRKNITLLLIIFLTPTVFAGVEATLSNHYLYPGDPLNFHVEISEDYTGTADLKFCLAEFDFNELSYNYRCDIFLERFDITFDKTYSNDYSLLLNGVQPLIYRLFVQLHFEDTYHKDSDSGNFIYLAKSDEQVTYIYNPKGITITPKKVPSTAEAGGEISVEFNITSFENCTKYYAYSFINKNNTCITGALNENMISVQLPYSSTMQLTLNNTIFTNSTVGDYEYTIRISGCGKNHDYEKPIMIIRKENPEYNIVLEYNELVLKNYEETNLTYTLTIIEETKTTIINNTLTPHSQVKLVLNNTNQYLTLKLNNIEVFNKLLIINNTQVIIVNNTIINNTPSLITGNAAIENIEEEKPFYILSILTGLGSLGVLYWRLK